MDYSILIQIVVAGVATGGVYGLIALGFVLIYKATSILNLAMGEFMTLGAFVCFTALTSLHLPFYIAFIITLAFAVLLALSKFGITIAPFIAAIGAAAGAITGQAIGRDTKGTLIGTAIGGMLGYLVGNDLDQQRGQSPQGYYPPQRVVHQYEDNYPQVQVYDRPVVYYRPAPVVRQVVIIDRGRDYPPRFKQNRGHDREHWQKSRFRTAYQCYPERGRR